MALRNFTNAASACALSSGVIALDTVLPVTTYSGWPTAPFNATLDLGGASPEIVLVQSLTPSAFTVLRGQGGTSATPHSAGVTITHTSVAADFSEANAHVNATAAVHGVAGTVVGTTDSQTLTNKTLTSPTLNTITSNASASAPAATFKAAGSGTQDIADFSNSAGVALTRIAQDGGVQTPTVTVLATTDRQQLRVFGVAGQTLNLIQALDSASHQEFAVSRNGKVLITPFTEETTAIISTKNASASPTASALEHKDSTGAVVFHVDQNGGLYPTGINAQPNGIFDKINTSDNKFRVDPNSHVVLSGAKLTLDATQPNNVPTTPTKLGKRIHWGTATVTTDGSGYANITHGAGFTPTVVTISWQGQSLGGGIDPVGPDTLGATTFRIRASASTTVTIGFICCE